MLQEVLEYIHNYFRKDSRQETFTINDGVISPSLSLKDGQRFWIVGSDLNDGVYTFHSDWINNDDDTRAAGLQNETFAGTICALGIPPALIALSAEISQWVDQNRGSLVSPYQSESFNGYSYTVKTGADANGGSGQLTWRDIYRKQLERWRKPCV